MNKSSDIKLVLFDWFGVVVAELTQILIQQFSLNPSQQQALQAANALSDRKYIDVHHVYAIQARLTAESSGRTYTPQQAKAWLDQFTQPDMELLQLVKHLREQGIKVVVASNASSDHRQNLVNQGQLNHFDQIYVSSLMGYAKPNPDFFHYILDQQGIPAHQTLFIDDSIKNVEGARQAGLLAEHYVQWGDPKSARTILQKHNLL